MCGTEGQGEESQINKPKHNSGSNYYRSRTFWDISGHFGRMPRSAVEPRKLDISAILRAV
jgi:hypothetical protein